MAEYNELYQKAVYYDIVFNRDVSREVDFIGAVNRKFRGQELKSVLDLACGPGYHAQLFTRRGVRAVGLDLRPEMLALAKDKANTENLELTWLQADMRDFQLDSPVDVAIAMFDGIDALQTNEEYIRHFRCIAKNLTSRGLYIIDLTHPRDCSFEHYGSYRYSGKRNGVAVEIDWAVNNPRFDRVTSIARVDLVMKVNDQGKDVVIHDSAFERLLSPQEISLLTELSGVLKVVSWCGDFDLNQPLDDSPASRRMIVVLQKKE